MEGNRSKPGEITITRRLYRSGESEYLIDGHQARLRDIQDLFMGTGLGPESYAIIEQGRIGQILSSQAAGPRGRSSKKPPASANTRPASAWRKRNWKAPAESGARVRHSRRSGPAGKFAQAPGIQDAALRELKAEMDAKLRLVLAARFRQLEREAAKAALDLNLASNELRTISEDSHGQRAGARAAAERPATRPKRA